MLAPLAAPMFYQTDDRPIFSSLDLNDVCVDVNVFIVWLLLVCQIYILLDGSIFAVYRRGPTWKDTGVVAPIRV